MPVNSFLILTYCWIALSVIIFFVLLKISAPYGRHTRTNWGPPINSTLGWVVMEIVSPLVFAIFFFQGEEKGLVNWTLFGLWMFHYFNRSIIYPLRASKKDSSMPLLICVFAVIFNSVNGFLNGYYLGVLKNFESSWFTDFRFIAGVLIFITGFIINFHSDNTLLALRKQKGGYKIPFGGMYKWISSPNYFGEILEWFGWALATWSLPGLTFALWTFANLFPRALSHHKWYKGQFQDYPKDRKAILPFAI